MKKHLSFSLLLSSFISLHSFAQDNPLFRHLPPDATSVYQVNVPALVSKLNWQDLIGKLPMNPKDNKSGHMMEMMKNPFATGINITKDFFVTETDKGNPDSATYTTIVFHLADSAKFVAFLSKQEQGLRFFNYPNKGRAAGKDKYGVAWDKEVAVITIIKPGGGDQPSSYKSSPQGKPLHPVASYTVLAAKKSFAALKGFDGSMYTTDPVFKAGFSDDADMHMWAPRGAGISMLAKNIMNKGHGKDARFSKAMAAMYQSKAHTLTALRFEAGKITLKSTTAYPPDSLAFFAKFAGRPLNTDLVARLPKGNLLAMINLHFDPSAIGEMLDRTKSRAKIDSMLAKKELTVDNIIRSFKGDILLAVVDPADKPGDSSGKKQPSIYIVTTIDDLSSFRELAGKMKLMKDSTATSSEGNAGGDSVKVSLMDKLKMAYTLKDNILVVSLSKQLTDAYFSNTDKRNTDFIPARMKDSPFSLFIDVKTLMGFLQGMNRGEPSEKDKKIMNALNKLDAFILTGGAIQDGKVETYMELKMTDPSENSLRSLIKMIQ
jgi:hypothetical protein